MITIGRMPLAVAFGPRIPPDASDAARDSKCLVVLLHGIYGFVYTMHRLFTDIRKMHVDVCAPRMPSCDLSAEDCAGMVLRIIESYLSSHSDAAVVLVGLSNGGRVACYVEHAMRQAFPHTPVLLASVAGVVTGTVVIDHVGACPIDPLVRQQLAYRSRESLDLIARMREPLPVETVREFVFYATQRDQLVRPIVSALPDIGHGAQHFLLDGCGHMSIMDVAHVHIVQMIQMFIAYDDRGAVRPTRTC